jgi:hypothetical protein
VDLLTINFLKNEKTMGLNTEHLKSESETTLHNNVNFEALEGVKEKIMRKLKS